MALERQPLIGPPTPPPVLTDEEMNRLLSAPPQTMSDAQMTAVDSLPKVLTDDQMSALPAQEPLTAEKADQETIERMRQVEMSARPQGPTIGPLPSKAKTGTTWEDVGLKTPKKTIPTDQLDYGWLEKAIDVPAQAMMRGINGVLFNVPEFASKKLAGEGIPPPKSGIGKVAGAAGELGGMITGPFALAGKLVSFGKPAASVIGKVLQSIAKKAVTLGAASAASEWSGDNVKENIVNRLKAGAGGAATGAIFGTADFMNLKSVPLTSWILRAGMSSAALDAINGQSPWDDRDLLDKAYSYGLNIYFTRNGISPKTYNTLVEEAKRVNADIKKDGIEYKFPETQAEIEGKSSSPAAAPEAPVTMPEPKAETRPIEGRAPIIEPIAEAPVTVPEQRITATPESVGEYIKHKPTGTVFRVVDNRNPTSITVDNSGKPMVLDRRYVEPVAEVAKPVAESPQTPVFQPAERAQAAPEPKTIEGGYPPTGKTEEARLRGIEEDRARWEREHIGVRKFGSLETFMEIPIEETRASADIGVAEAKQALAERTKPMPEAPTVDAAGYPRTGVYKPMPKRTSRQFSQGLQPEEYTGLQKYLHEKKMGTYTPPKKAEGARAPGYRGRTEAEYIERQVSDYAVARIEDGKAMWNDLTPDEQLAVEHYAPADDVANWKALSNVEVLPEFTKEQAEAKAALEQKAKRDRVQGLPEKLTISPEWKPEWDALIIPALEKAKIKPEHRANATLLLKHGFSMAKVTGKDPAKAMEHYLNSIKTRLRADERFPETQMPEVKTEEGTLEIEPTEAMAKGEAGPKGKNIIEDIAEVEKQRQRTDELHDFVNRLADEHEATITDQKEKAAFSLWKKLAPKPGESDVPAKEMERILQEKLGIKKSDDTVRKWMGKWRGDLGKKKQAVIDFLSQRDEAEDIIEREFIKPEGRVKSGGTLPPRPGEPTANQPKYAGSVNLERIDEGVELKDIILKESERWGDFEKNRRTGMTFDEISELADALGKTPEDMARIIKAKTKELPEYMVHFRDILAKAAQDVQKLAIENRDRPSVESEAKFAMAFKRFEYILGTSEAGASEMGRGLASFNILSKAKEFAVVKNYKEILKRLGSQAKNADIMRMLSQLDPNDPMAVAKFLRGAIKATTKDKLFELWVNGLLSNPKTWIRNFVSNAITAPIMPLTRTIAGIAELRRGKAREISLMETPAMMQSIVPGIKDGVRRALFAWNNEMTMANLSKIETAHYGAIKGTLGKVVRTPGKMLMVGDEFFKGALRTADIYAMATRQAFKEGKKGEARLDRIAELIKNPTEEMEGHAVGEALYYTFQKELGKTGKELMALREKFPAFKFIAPFLRTPINIAKFGVEHTPLKFMDILYKVKTKGLKGTALSTELSKAGLGTLTAIAVTLSVLDGDITGSAPQDPEERAAFFRQGKKEYAVKAGNAWYSYGYLEPVGTSIGIVADFALTMDNASEQEKAKIAGKILTSFYKNLSSKTFNTGIINFLDAARDPGRGLSKLVKGLAGSVVPSNIAGIAGAIDPDMRDARTILDKVKSRIPAVGPLKPISSKSLPPRRDIFGEVQKKTGTGISRLISPIEISPAKDTALESELSRLKIFPSMPDRKIKGRELSAAQYDRYVSESGKLMKAWISDIIDDPDYKGLPDEVKDRIVRGRINAARAFARNELFADMISGKEND